MHFDSMGDVWERKSGRGCSQSLWRSTRRGLGSRNQDCQEYRVKASFVKLRKWETRFRVSLGEHINGVFPTGARRRGGIATCVTKPTAI